MGTPDPGTFWRTITRHGVKSFFTAPTAIRAVRKEDPDAKFLAEIGTGDCQAIFLAGERADPDTIAWLEEKSGLPVIDHWWQTELGWPGIATCFALGDLRRKRGSAGFPVPGYAFEILGDDGQPVPAGQSGFVAIREPLAPGAFRTLWNNTAGYAKNFASFPGYYETGDAGHFDEEGFLHIMGRTDDIINVAGHRLSTGQMEQIVAHRTAGRMRGDRRGRRDQGHDPDRLVVPRVGFEAMIPCSLGSARCAGTGRGGRAQDTMSCRCPRPESHLRPAAQDRERRNLQNPANDRDARRSRAIRRGGERGGGRLIDRRAGVPDWPRACTLGWRGAWASTGSA